VEGLGEGRADESSDGSVSRWVDNLEVRRPGKRLQAFLWDMIETWL
jgi:hypothetical protein